MLQGNVFCPVLSTFAGLIAFSFALYGEEVSFYDFQRVARRLCSSCHTGKRVSILTPEGLRSNWIDEERGKRYMAPFFREVVHAVRSRKMPPGDSWQADDITDEEREILLAWSEKRAKVQNEYEAQLLEKMRGLKSGDVIDLLFYGDPMFYRVTFRGLEEFRANAGNWRSVFFRVEGSPFRKGTVNPTWIAWFSGAGQLLNNGTGFELRDQAGNRHRGQFGSLTLTGNPPRGEWNYQQGEGKASLPFVEIDFSTLRINGR